MKSFFILLGLLFSAAAFLIAQEANDKNSTVVVYPSIPGLITSDLYSVEVNGKEIWTEKFRTNFDVSKFPDWFLEPYTKVQQEIHQASFSCRGKINVAIRVRHSIVRVSVHPLSLGITPAIKGDLITFSLSAPRHVVVQVDSLPPLFLFANSIERDEISPMTRGVHYFGPGVHRPGYITLKDSETIYIAAGGIVYGGIRAKGVHNIRVLGRGILDGEAKFSQMVLIENCRDVLVDGVMIRNGDGWTNTLVNCDGITYNNVKVLGFGPACDGIDAVGSRKVRITNCFLRCTDDCIAIKAPYRGQNVDDVLVSGNTMLGFAFSDGVTIGFETDADSVANITVRNCDVLLARGGSRVDGHSGFSIICDGPSVISNVLYDSIRVERAEIKLFELNITDGTKYGDGPPGHIQNITLKNISWMHEGPIVLKGFDEGHKIRLVVFDNCTVAGKPLRAGDVNAGQFVDDVVIR
jgi:hypothetical protein